ncbi:BspA family leucine-rich repeat surface protein, partial [Flagellimonas sp. 389]|uniref:BspA family leucine-rich repeat surface protein n=1 Tax=Flagellimonas sp. 389 TaxID=2835862 RepID=UPI001BD57037
MKKIRFLNLMILSLTMFAVSCSSDDNGTTTPTPTSKPTISGFTPSSGPVGTAVTINGTNFSTTPASNTVKIGAITATVSTATATKLTISVPQGASTGAVSVGVGGETVTGSTFTVTETEAQNTVPVITNQTTTTEVDENANNEFTIFTVTATDADADDTLTFEITDGNGEGLFSIDENGLITLADGQNLDFETAPEHSITVTVSDGNGGTDQISVQIAVKNVIENLFEDPASFIFTLETAGANEEFSIEVFGEGEDVDFQIDWGDGQPEEHVTEEEAYHQYQTADTYTVALKGQVGRLSFFGQDALRTVEQWGDTAWKSMEDMFHLDNDDIYVAINATGEPNLEQCTSFSYAFPNADFKQNINDWKVGNVTNMLGTFAYNTSFNQDISGWNVSNVETMRLMFFRAAAFNQDISGWVVSSVTSMTGMFQYAGSFNQPIGGWNVGNVTDMGQMFQYAQSFNQPIANWDVSNVIIMRFMFDEATAFNQSLGAWNIGSVVNMENMLTFSGMSAPNFSDTLIGWADQVVQPNVV